MRARRAHGGNRPFGTVPPLPELCPASHFVPHRGQGLLHIGDEVAANQSGRLVCMSGLWPQGSCAAAAALFIFGLVHFRLGENERGSFALCGARPGSTWTGQPARLDRAGPQARTRLSPAGGIRLPVNVHVYTTSDKSPRSVSQSYDAVIPLRVYPPPYNKPLSPLSD